MAIGAHHQSAPWKGWKSSSGGCISWEECHEKTSSEALSSRTLWLGHELEVYSETMKVFSRTLFSWTLTCEFICICHFCIVDIVISRKGECSEGLRTSFITDMRSVVWVRARGFLIRPYLLSRTRFSVVCPLNKFKVRSDALSLNFWPVRKNIRNIFATTFKGSSHA